VSREFVTLFGSHGDVGYIPQGYGHSIENVGSGPARVLIGFNAGIYETIDLSQWIAANPNDVLAIRSAGIGQGHQVVCIKASTDLAARSCLRGVGQI
jgi:oxalate decarboxylase/phosphoglucose isomerase-like protein (cupin superfamily)